ncbi:MAG: Por secretion system C-terminal sorting protein [Bacteroidetes bacterium]|nr:Por secretion system C-terminal sorting protein [Bacteroidota bacterium]
MKKIYTLIAATAIVFSASAQRTMSNQHKLDGFTPKIKHTVNTGRTTGDTLYYFDGESFYGTGLDATFNYALDDLDGKTIWTAGQPYFGTTDAFTFFYELLPTPGDTNFYMAATSYFSPVGCCADNWFEVGPINIPMSGATYSWGHNLPDPTYRDGYEILVSTTGLSNLTDFTDPAIFAVADNDPTTAADTAQTPSNTYYQRSVSLAAYAGQSIYLALHHNANDQFIINFDDFVVIEGPSSVGVTEFVNGVKVAQNSPNPFGTTSTISYMLEKNCSVALSVYDVTGKMVASQSEGQQTAGTHSLKFNAENLSAGVYYYTLSVNGNAASTMKMVVVK